MQHLIYDCSRIAVDVQVKAVPGAGSSLGLATLCLVSLMFTCSGCYLSERKLNITGHAGNCFLKLKAFLRCLELMP